MNEQKPPERLLFCVQCAQLFFIPRLCVHHVCDGTGATSLSAQERQDGFITSYINKCDVRQPEIFQGIKRCAALLLSAVGAL